MDDGGDEASGTRRTESGADELLLTAAKVQDSNRSADEQSGGRERDGSAPQSKKRARSSNRVAKPCVPLVAADNLDDGSDIMTSSSLRADAKTPQHFRVGGLKERHASWSELSLYVAYYMHATQTRIEASETVTFSQQNAMLRAVQAFEDDAIMIAAHGSRAGRSSHQRLFPESSETYSRTFMCRGPHREHHHEHESEEEQRGECPFRFVAHVVRERDAWRILVPSASQHCFHNHAVVGGLRVPRNVVTNIRTTMKQSPARRRAGTVVPPVVDRHKVLERDCGRESILEDSRTAESKPERALSHASTEGIGADEIRNEDDAVSEEEDDDDGDDIDTALESDAAPSGDDTGSTLQAPPMQSSLLQQHGFALKEYYESWGELFSAVDEYMHVTCTKLVLRTSCSVAKHNKNVLLDSTRRATKQIRSGGNQQMELMPETWQMAARQFGCTHGWSTTRPVQGLKVKTVTAATRKPGERCQFRIRAIVVKVGNEWRIRLPVHLQNQVHNHTLRMIFSLSSGESAAQYPINLAPSLVSPRAWQNAVQAHPPRHRQLMHIMSGLPLPATHVKETHDSWDDFFAYLRAYMHSTKSNIVIKHTTSISTRNQEILDSGHLGYLLPESLKTFAHRFGCSFQEQFSTDTECPFRFTAHVIKVNDAWRIHVPISLQSCTHNHAGSNPIVEQSQQQVSTPNANLLDIRTIPRDHPLYEAICELANRQHLQQQQAAMASSIGGVTGIPIAPLSSINAQDAGMHVPSHQMHTQLTLTRGPQSQDAPGFSWNQSVERDMGSRVIHNGSEALSHSDLDEADQSGEEDTVDSATNPTVETTTTTLHNFSGKSQEVRVASLQEFHASWESLSMYLHEYMRETKTKIVIGGSTSVSKRNQQMKQTQHAQRNEVLSLIPEELSVYYRRYICTHGSEKRIRSQGLRQTRHLRATGCKFQFSAHVAKINNVWCIHVPLKSQCCVHNHPVEQEQFESYASFRMVPKVHPLYDEIRKMVLAGSDKTARIYEFIRANSSFKVTKKDVRNMIQTMKKG